MTEVTSLISVTPRQARELIEDAVTSGVVPFVKSSPGVGKSSLIHSIAEDNSLIEIDHRMSTSQPEDMSGLPEFYDSPNKERRARFVPFGDLFPLKGDIVPTGSEGWLLFLDEFNSAPKEVQAACYKLILDRKVGQYSLHERVIPVLAGNLDTDRAITNKLSTAMQSRVVHLHMKYSHEDWRDDVMIPQKWDRRIVTFIEQFPSKGMNFRPEHNDETFACPRTWEFINKMIKGKEFKTNNGVFEMTRKQPLYGGTIGTGMAAEFVQFCRVWGELPPISEILRDPLGANVPQEQNTAWCTMGMISEHVSEENFTHLATYADRFRMNLRVLFYRLALDQHPALRRHPEFINKMGELARYLSR